MIFIDTSAWIALLTPTDQFHEKGREISRRIAIAGTTLVTTDYIVSETFTHLRYNARDAHKIRKFDALLSESEKNKNVILRWTTEKIFQQARRILLEYSDQKFSFTDCISFVVAKELKITEIFSFDRDFTVMGFHLLR